MVCGQTQVNLRNQSRMVDFSGALSTRSEKQGQCCRVPATPANCFLIPCSERVNLYGCVALSGGAGDTGGPGICAASNTPNALACTISGIRADDGVHTGS